ncbi:hypothetical protein FLONG3_6870 [Fusarium longipes]|uniref:Xylanolytic transcriptional activator regulatory domain-containing protein n=1 Tax=Fusarium longipes TaxID=694270 RepID=A0A395SJ73_9HYPO|nr:hypothetical protein FLONG3_6870 [Fusarium longipes]
MATPEEPDSTPLNRRKGELTNVIRRKPSSTKGRVAKQQQDNKQDGLESRLKRIEEHLQVVLNAAKDAQAAKQPTWSPESLTTIGDSSDPNSNHEGIEEELAKFGVFSWKFNPVRPVVYEGPQPNSLDLPPLEEVLPVANHYFSTFNTVIPLFQQQEYMKILRSWYNQPNTRTRARWAAIQCVMAIGYRTPQLSLTDSQAVHIEKADQCLRNVQSVVSELVTRESDLLGVQILLGIVMLFQNSRDPKPASVLIGTALRLAHRLRLHSQEAAMNFPAAEAEHRSRVFWIAYVLDKDIGLRANTPSCQNDDDIDIALPTLAPLDSAGLIWTQNGQVHFNYHRRRVELAYIEGKVYDLLHSNRASRITPQERQRRVERLQSMIDQWYERIPQAFHIENVAATVGPSQLVQMTKMHHAFLLTEVMIHGIYSYNKDWQRRISSFGRETISGGDQNGGKKEQAPLPEGWNQCVDVSRGCMKLFQEATPTECLVWQCSYSHFSALIVLLANMILNPGHTSIHTDQHISIKALDLFDKLLKIVDDEAFRALRSVVGDLSQRAQEAVRAHRQHLKSFNKDIYEPINVEETVVQELDFLPNDDGFESIDGPFAGLESGIDFDAIGFGQDGGGMRFVDGDTWFLPG